MIKLTDTSFMHYVIMLGIAMMLNSGSLHAEIYKDRNVAGDEIIIFLDDSFRPAPRYIGADQAPTKGNTAEIAAIDNSKNQESLKQNSAQTVSEIEVGSDDLWQRIQNGYAMPDSTSNLTAKYEDWYSSRPDYVQRMVDRSQRYLFHIVEEIEKRGMPTELAFLPMIESAYNPQANSVSNAAGIWQFIPSTGKHFGLKQNWWVDNRRNITFATDAALDYLQKLYGMFGAWDLALAAYNAGEGTVGRSIERNRKLGLPTDYESIILPDETRNYVPKLQAVKNIMTNPGQYGLNIQTIANTPYFAKVNAPAQIDSKLAARLAEISNDEFLALNPSYKRPIITNTDGKHELLLPILSAETFRTNLTNYDKPLVSWRTYQAKRGESLDKIAAKFGINVSKLRDVNNLPAWKKVKSALTLLVPNGNQTNVDTPTQTSADKYADADQVQTLTNIQNAENIDIANIENHTLDSGNQVANTQQYLTHKVKKGEVMQSIARRYGVSVKQVMAANSLKSTRLRAGQLLNITTAGTSKNTANKSSAKKRTYTVKRGDTLHSIADKFNVAIVDIKRWNKISNNHIQPGNKLIIM